MAVLPTPGQALAFLLLLTTIASLNVMTARREQAFNLRDFEDRYLKTGRYLDAVLPSEAVILAVQESGSARFYARPVVRWDLLPVDLDQAVTALTTLHRRPVLVVEDWETTHLRKRFPESRVARLDWRPRADIGTNVRVLLFDPADRGRLSGQPPTDRFR